MAQRTSPQPAKQAAAKAFNTFNLVSFTVGAKTTNTINVAMVFQDARGQTLAQVVSAFVYLSDSADGHTLTATALTSAIAIGTNGVILDTPVSEKEVHVITSVAGLIDLNLIQTASPQAYYLCVVMPDGSLQISPIIQF